MSTVSIIIPAYNAAKYVCETIHSALAQTVRPLEVIVVDDGSTDNTVDVIKSEFANRTHISLQLMSKSKGGTASALNYGIKKSQGDFIHWLSADDVLYPDALEKMLKVIDNHPNKENCIFYSHYDYINEKSQIINIPFIEPNYNEDQDKLKRELWDHHLGNGSSSMIHKSIFGRIGLFDTDVKYCEDYEFWMRAALLARLKLWLVPEMTLHYRIHSEQLTQTLGQGAAPFIKNCRRKIYSQMTEQQRAVFDEPR